jgi:hypothetical protein
MCSHVNQLAPYQVGAAEGLKIWGCMNKYKAFWRNKFCFIAWQFGGADNFGRRVGKIILIPFIWQNRLAQK